MMQKILVIGGEGQLGKELCEILQSQRRNFTACDRRTLDLSDVEEVEAYIESLAPNIIINCAAYTAVDRAETQQEAAFAVNYLAVQAIAAVAEKLDSYFIHISTDYVFDGCAYTPYSEDALTQPRSIYGQSKQAGETAIMTKVISKYVIVRTAWVYGVYGKGNFVKTMLKLGKERENLGVVADQIGAPTWTYDLAISLTKICDQLSPEISGIYHFTNSGVCSWYDFATAIFAEAERLGFPLKLQQLNPITTADYPTPAQRPHYSVLSTRKITNLLGAHPPHWQESLRKMLTSYLQK